MGHPSHSLTVAVPSLNEDAAQIDQLVRDIAGICRTADIRVNEFVIFDAGSDAGAVRGLIDAARGLVRDHVPISCIGAGVAAKPNKNLGVFYAAQLSTATMCLVVDADWSNLPHNDIERLLRISSDADRIGMFPEPNLPAGRDNLLVGGPLLRLFAPNLYAQVRTPFPGCYAAQTSRLTEIVGGDYHHDWGGEVDIVLGLGAEPERIASPSVVFTERRHRSMDAKVVDSLQMYRAGLAHAGRSDSTATAPSTAIADHLSRYPELTVRFDGFLRHRLSLQIETFVTRVDYFFHRRDAQGLYDWLFDLGLTQRIPELCVVADMTLPAVSRLMFGAVLARKRIDEAVLNHKSPTLRDVQVAADIIVHCALPFRMKSNLEDLPISEFTPVIDDLVRSRPKGLDLLSGSDATVTEYVRLHNARADSIEARSIQLAAL